MLTSIAQVRLAPVPGESIRRGSTFRPTLPPKLAHGERGIDNLAPPNVAGTPP